MQYSPNKYYLWTKLYLCEIFNENTFIHGKSIVYNLKNINLKKFLKTIFDKCMTIYNK